MQFLPPLRGVGKDARLAKDDGGRNTTHRVGGGGKPEARWISCAVLRKRLLAWEKLPEGKALEADLSSRKISSHQVGKGLKERSRRFVSRKGETAKNMNQKEYSSKSQERRIQCHATEISHEGGRRDTGGRLPKGTVWGLYKKTPVSCKGGVREEFEGLRGKRESPQNPSW